MRIGKSVFNIIVTVILILLVISFIRITLVGGSTGYRLSFASFVDTFVNIDFDMSRFFVDLGGLVDGLSSGFRRFASVGNISFSGKSLLEKILSVFLGVEAILVGFYTIFVSFVTSSANLLYDLYLLLVTFFNLIGSLFGVFFLKGS